MLSINFFFFTAWHSADRSRFGVTMHAILSTVHQSVCETCTWWTVWVEIQVFEQMNGSQQQHFADLLFVRSVLRLSVADEILCSMHTRRHRQLTARVRRSKSFFHNQRPWVPAPQLSQSTRQTRRSRQRMTRLARRIQGLSCQRR